MIDALRRRRRGFTLIELLVVVAIIMILATMIMTAIYSAQESGRAAVCRGNLKQLHQMMLQYATTYGGYLPHFWHERWVGQLDLVGKRWGHLKDDLNPKVATVWNNLSPAQNWIGEERALIRTGAPVLRCPSDLSSYRCDQGCLVSYMGLAKYGWWHRGNLNATASYAEHHQLSEVTEQTTSIMLMESQPGTWQMGGCGCRWHTYRHPIEIVPRHYGGGHVLLFDSRVELVRGDRTKVVTLANGSQMEVADNMVRYWEPNYDLTNPGY